MCYNATVCDVLRLTYKLCTKRASTGVVNCSRRTNTIVNSTTVDAADDDVENGAEQPETQGEQDQDLCEVCLIQARDARAALVICGHQRFLCVMCVPD